MGPEALAAGGLAQSPLAPLLPLTFQPPEHRRPRSAVVLVIDKSGSMGRERKLQYTKVAAHRVLSHLAPGDLFGVIGFDREPFTVVPLQRIGSRADELGERIDHLRAAGGTYLLPALEEAYSELRRVTADRKHVIILTDGETGGGVGAHLDLADAMRADRITLSTIAVGEEANLRLLGRIADIGGGAFHQTADPSSLPEIFVGELDTPGRDTRIVERSLVPTVSARTALVPHFAGRQLPALSGLVATELKPRASLDASAGRDTRPLLASWTVGRGRVAAFASDLAGRWSAAWLDWRDLGRFCGDAVRALAPRLEPRDDVDLRVGYRDQALHVEVTSYERAQLDGARLLVSDPAGRERAVPLVPVAPGRLRASFATRTAGDYRIRLAGSGAASEPTTGFTVSPALVDEVPRPESNGPLLSTLAGASATGPAAITRPSPGRPSHAAVRPQFLTWILGVTIVLIVLEVTTRRLGW
jgi:hypothetical protein